MDSDVSTVVGPPSIVVDPHEVLLLHGTSDEMASRIAREGLDDGLSTRAMYGNGIYTITNTNHYHQLIIHHILTYSYGWT